MSEPPKTIIFLFRRDIEDKSGVEQIMLRAGVFDIQSSVGGATVYQLRQEVVRDAFFQNQYYYDFKFDETLAENIMFLKMEYPGVPLIRYIGINMSYPATITVNFSKIPKVGPVEFVKLKNGKKTCIMI